MIVGRIISVFGKVSLTLKGYFGFKLEIETKELDSVFDHCLLELGRNRLFPSKVRLPIM